MTNKLSIGCLRCSCGRRFFRLPHLHEETDRNKTSSVHSIQYTSALARFVWFFNSIDDDENTFTQTHIRTHAHTHMTHTQPKWNF